MNSFNFLISSAKFLGVIPFHNLMIKFINKIPCLFSILFNTLELFAQLLYLLRVSFFDQLIKFDIQNFKLLKVLTHVLEYPRHFIVQSPDKFIFIMVRGVSVHIFARLTNLIKLLFIVTESFFH